MWLVCVVRDSHGEPCTFSLVHDQVFCGGRIGGEHSRFADLQPLRGIERINEVCINRRIAVQRCITGLQLLSAVGWKNCKTWHRDRETGAYSLGKTCRQSNEV